MIRKQDGFTLVELLITMVIFVITIAAASKIFTAILTQFKQQSKIAETNVEGVIGLETLRYDIEQAGYGLPWFVYDGANNTESTWAALANYNEATVNTYNDGAPASALPVGGVRAPRGIIIGHDEIPALLNNSNRIVLKAANMAINNAAQKWTYITNSPPSPNTIRTWTGVADEILLPTDSIIVIKPVKGDRQRLLVTNGGVFSTTLGALPASNFEPNGGTPGNPDTHIIYGIKENPPPANPRVPFNRTDYYISTANIPARCAPNTGVLSKAVLHYGDGNFTEYPLVDCVIDMQVIVMLDNDGNSATPNVAAPNVDGLTAEEIRNQVKEIRVYIVAHEGQEDVSFNYVTPNPAACLGTGQRFCINDPNFGLVKNFEITRVNYRWKLYTLVVTPNSLR